MQFKIVNGNRIQLVIYRGFNAEKGRPIVKTIGAITKDTLEPVGNLLELLNEEQRQELDSYVERTKAARAKEYFQAVVDNVAKNMKEAAEVIRNGDALVDQGMLESMREAAIELNGAIDDKCKEAGY